MYLLPQESLCFCIGVFFCRYLRRLVKFSSKVLNGVLQPLLGWQPAPVKEAEGVVSSLCEPPAPHLCGFSRLFC